MSRSRRNAVATASLLAVVATVLGPARASGPPRPVPERAPCASPSYVGGLGWTCPAPGGYLVLYGDGLSGFTHGGDPVPTHINREHLDTKPRNVACVRDTDNEFHIQVIYAHPSDQGSRYIEKVGEIRTMVKQANGLLYADAQEFNRARKFRVACAGSKPSVIEVTLPSINERQDYGQVLTEVRRAGYASPLAKYLIYYDGRPPEAPAGTAIMANDQQLDADNQNNYGPYYAVSWGIPDEFGGAGVLMHELGHTLGAVQDGAPNSTRRSHCNDGIDIMCYDDGGVAANYKGNVCSRVHFDCNHNDYFHPNPKGRSYLGRNWNVGSPLNRFLKACTYRTGMIQADPEDVAASAPNGTVHLAIGNKVKIPKGCRGHRFAVSAMVPPLPPEVYEVLGNVPYPVTTGGDGYFGVGPLHRIVDSNPALRPEVNVCFYRYAKRLRCFDGAGADTGKVPGKANKARVTLDAGPAAVWVLSVD